MPQALYVNKRAMRLEQEYSVGESRGGAVWPYALAIVLFLILAVGYIVYLDYGCAIEGYMTWEGKQCVV